jgi:hypothetical protein
MAGVPHIRSSIVPSNWFIPRLSNPKLPQFQGSGSSSAGVTERSSIGGGKYSTVEASKQTASFGQRAKEMISDFPRDFR